MILYRLTEAWKRLSEVVIDERKKAFPYHSVVYVNCAKYHGFGIVDCCDGVPLHQICVLLENGNSWYYDTQDCALSPRNNRHLWPNWIHRRFKSWSAQKAVTTRMKNERGDSH